MYYPKAQEQLATMETNAFMVFASAGEAIAMETEVNVDQQADVSSSLFCIAWDVLNIILSNEYTLVKNEHLPHTIYH